MITSENKISENKGQVWLWIGLGVLLTTIWLAWQLLPLSEWLHAFISWMDSLGPWAVVIFGAAYVLGTVLLAPGSAMSIAAGLAFGGWAIPLVLVAATTGASLAFLIARHLARDTVARLIEERPKLKAVDNAVDEEGWKVVVLLRLSPMVPFNLQNYAFGLTRIRFWTYAAATFAGIIPGTVLYVYLGTIARAAASDGSGGPFRWLLFGAGLAATLAVAVLVARKAKEKLRATGVEVAS
jgi:uncharacterized membrane protein YdjX (TVP38/TMEM64 family)